MEERKDFIEEIKNNVQQKGETDEEFICRMRKYAENKVVQKTDESYEKFCERRYWIGIEAERKAREIIENRKRSNSRIYKNDKEKVEGMSKESI